MAKKKYNDGFPLRAEDLARRGMTDPQIAKSLGIAVCTLYVYQNLYPEFSDAIKRGKAPVDVEVENALLKRALGYEYEEVTIEYKPVEGDGKGKEEEKTKPTLIRKTQKQKSPDVTAQIIWLKNRRPKLWKDKHSVDITGDMNIKVITAVPRPKGCSSEVDRGKNGSS